MGIVDLHIHSTASDGTKTPAELLRVAHSKGLSVISVTDHDTFGGIPEAIATAEDLKQTFIPGIEFSVNIENRSSVHLLGYFPHTNIDVLIDPDTPLGEAVSFILGGRDRRNPKILEKLAECNVHIRMEDVERIAGGEVIGRPHIARAILEAGYIKNMREAFDLYLAKAKPAYVDRERLPIKDVVSLIAEAGGYPVLAHPYYIDLSRLELEEFLRELRWVGLVGVEAYYPRHTADFTNWLVQTARRLGLVITGGTDFHGLKEIPVPLGGSDEFSVTTEMISEFLELCTI